MKQTFLFAVLFLLGNLTMHAQKTISTGAIKMEITDVNSDNEQMMSGLQMLKGSESVYTFMKGKYFTSMNMMGGMIKMDNHVNSSTQKMDMLMDMMGNKIWIDTNMEEAKGGKSVQSIDPSKIKISYDPADTKQIEGFDCYAFTAVIDDPQAKTEISGYITEGIKTDGNLVQGLGDANFKGFPLEFTVKNPMMSMKMATVSIEEEVDASVFEFSTEGYQKMTFEEFIKSTGGGMPMGF